MLDAETPGLAMAMETNPARLAALSTGAGDDEPVRATAAAGAGDEEPVRAAAAVAPPLRILPAESTA